MLKKLPVLLLLCALCAWAADFWTTKPFTEWNEKEVQKILSDSPWTGKITVSTPEVGAIGDKGGKGGGGRGGGRSGPQGDSIDPGADGTGGAVPSGIPITLFWQTALPIKQALIKRQYGAEAGTSAEAKAKLDRVDPVYVLTMVGVPGFMLGAAQGDRKAALLDLTTMTASGKPPLKAVDVQVSGGRGTGGVSFLFPKTTALTVEDKEVEFFSKLGGFSVKKKFKLKDMVFNGRVEM